MQTDKFKFTHGGAEIQLPPDLIVRNWLDSLTPRPVLELAATTIPNIGMHWPEQGGVNAGLVKGVNGTPDYFLIVADPVDELLGEQKSHFENVTWGPEGVEVDNASCEWDGMANTKAILQHGGDFPAARLAAGVKVGSLDDFYLPARRELSVAYANVPQLFTPNWYWSSTQYSAFYASAQTFHYGGQHYGDKGARARAFAVRRVFINSVI